MFGKVQFSIGLIAFIFCSNYGQAQETCASNSSQPYEWPSQRNWFMAPNLYSGIVINMQTMGVTSVGGPGNAVTSYEGVSAASDDNGELLFYTNGRSLWKGTGSGVTKTFSGLLTGNEGGINNGSASQGVITVRHPLDPDRYWVITTDDAIAATKGMNAFSFDKAGNLLSGPTRLGSFRTSEAISATLHSNGVDIWVTCLASGGGQFYTYLLKCDGFDNTPVVSSIGPKVTSNRERGGMAYSWDGEYLAQAHPNWWPDGNKIVSIYKFNKSTGELYDAKNVSGVWGSPYDITWSPNNKRVYVSMQNSSIHYLDISSWNATTIKNSWTSTGISSAFSAIEVGYDGSMYVSHGIAGGGYLKKMNGDLNTATSFSVSNVAGTAGMSHLGLPTIYIPPSDEPDIQDVGTYCTTDPAIDLSTTWICSGNDAENPVENPFAYTGNGITDRANGIFDPSVAGPGTHQITFEYCSVNDTIWITVNNCTSCTSNLEDLQPEICVGQTYVLDGLISAASATGLWTIDSFLVGNLPTINHAGDITFDASSKETSPGIYKLLYTVDDGGSACYDSIYINVHPIPEMGLPNDTALCQGKDLLLNPGVFTSYIWNDGSSSPTLIASSTGTYWVQVEDAIGCSNRDSVDLTINQNPTPNIGPDQFICDGEPEVTFIAGEYEQYNWIKGGETTSTIQTSTSGEYIVEVTDAHLCVGSDTANLTVHPLPELSLGKDTTICGGNSLLLNAGSNHESYLWSDGSNQQELIVTTENSGVLHVTVTSSYGCSSRDTLEVAIASEIEVDLGEDRSICQGDSVVIDAGFVEGATYTWTPSGTSQELVIKASGNYTVTVSNSTGCSGKDTIDVVMFNLPTLDLGSDINICPGLDTSLSVGTGWQSIQWNDFSSNEELELNVAGTYYVSVTDDNLCSTTDTVLFDFFPSPSLELGEDRTICEGASAYFDAGSGFTSYSWQNQSSLSTYQGTDAEVIWVNIIDENGCTASDTAEILIASSLSVNLIPDTAICDGQAIELSAGYSSENYTINWSNNETTSEIIASETGIYSVSVEDLTGCSGSDSVEIIVNEVPEIHLGVNQEICEGEEVILDAGSGWTSVVWSTMESGQTILVYEADVYTAVVTNIHGCENTDSIQVIVNARPQPNLGTDQTLCSGVSAYFEAGPYSSFTWHDASTASNYSSVKEEDVWVEVVDEKGCKGSDTARIFVRDELLVDLGPDLEICNGDSIELSSGYQGQGNTFLWTTNATTESVLLSDSGIYGLEVTDQNGCKGTDTVQLIVNLLPIVTLDLPRSICEGDTLLLDAGNWSSVIWDDGTNDRFLKASASKNYAVTVTNDKGCEGYDEGILTVDSPSSIELGDDLEVCEGKEIIISVTEFEFVSYQWHDGSTGEVFITSTPQDISVEATDENGCIAFDTVALTNRMGLDIQLGDDLYFCEGESYEITASGFESGEYEFLWSDQSNASTLLVNETNDYSVIVSNNDGCEGQDTVSIIFYSNPQPVVEDATICAGEKALLKTGEYESYSWNSGETTQEITPAEAGEYTVTVVDENGCVGSVQGELIVHPTPVITEYETQLACIGDTLILSPELPSGSYEWTYDGSSNSSLEVSVSGEYKVLVSNVFGCVDSLGVQAVFKPVPEIELGENRSICFGDTAIVGEHSTDDVLTWNIGLEQDYIIVNQSGSYIATRTNSAGCASKDTIDVYVSPSPIAEATPDTAVCFDEIETLELAVSSYGREQVLWSSGEMDNEIVIDEEGTYSVTLTNEFGCKTTDTVVVTRECINALFVPNAFTPNGDGNNDEFGPKGVNVYDFNFYIFDRWGEQLFHSTNMDIKWDGTHLGRPCQLDVYVWKLSYKAEDQNGYFNVKQKMGTVTLVR